MNIANKIRQLRASAGLTQEQLAQRLGVGKWQIFGAHGFKKDYSVNS